MQGKFVRGWIRRALGGGMALAALFIPTAHAQTLGIALDQVQAGLERATRLPLEIVRLQADVLADMWKTPALAQLMPDCARLGAPKEGCSLARFRVTGGERVFLVAAPDSPSSPLVPVPAGKLVLAPGSTVQLVAIGNPSIQIELKAPADRPLYLGELAASEVGRILSLLVPQAGLSASAADVLPAGRVALRSKETAPVQVAAAAPASVVARTAEPAANMPAAIRALAESERAVLAEAKDILLLDNMPTAVVERIEVAAIAPAATGQPLLLDTMPVAVAEPAEPRIQIAEAGDVLVLDAMPVAVQAPLEAPVRAADAREVLVLDAMPAAIRAPVEKPVLAAPVLVAAAPAPGTVPALSSDIARLRAEIDAEVARENARLAQALHAAPAKTFRFGS